MSDDELKAFLAVGRPGEQLLAAEVTALRAKLAAAEKALRPFAKLAAQYGDDWLDKHSLASCDEMKVGDLRRAAAALRALGKSDAE